MWQAVKILSVFNTLTVKQIFWKMKTFFKKLEYRFLVESTKTENAPFPYKIAISEANVKTNRMVSTKRTDHKEWRFASNYFRCLKIFVSVWEPFLKSWFDVPTTQMSKFVLFVSAGVFIYP